MKPKYSTSDIHCKSHFRRRVSDNSLLLLREYGIHLREYDYGGQAGGQVGETRPTVVEGYRSYLASVRKAFMLVVETFGGMPPPQEKITRV